MGQLRMVLRSRFLVNAIGLNKAAGQPFRVREIVRKIERVLGGDEDSSKDLDEVLEL